MSQTIELYFIIYNLYTLLQKFISQKCQKRFADNGQSPFDHSQVPYTKICPYAITAKAMMTFNPDDTRFWTVENWKLLPPKFNDRAHHCLPAIQAGHNGQKRDQSYILNLPQLTSIQEY